MYYKLAKICLKFFDHFNKKKVLDFLRKRVKKNFFILIDVGAHHGESIKLFTKYFKIKKILAFEPSVENFLILKNKTKNLNNLELHNIAVGDYTGVANFKQHYDSESSTITEINENSNYFKKKNNLLNFFNFKEKSFSSTKVKISRLDKIFERDKIKKIDLLKIDTEGHDLYVIKGLGKNIKNIKVIYFEHHFHDMLKKNYTLSDVHHYLKENNFNKAFKNKMFFRKTFEYIYINNNIFHE